MATEKKTEAAKPEKPYDPMKDMISVTLPRATGREENFVFVALNGKGYKILRGQTVNMPRPVYDILAESERAEARQLGFMQQQLDLASRSAAAGC